MLPILGGMNMSVCFIVFVGFFLISEISQNKKKNGGDWRRHSRKNFGQDLGWHKTGEKRLSRKKSEGTGQVFSISGFLRCLWILHGKADMA